MQEDFKDKTIIITGGSGFIGSNFIRYVFQNYEGVKVVNLDKLTYSGNPDNLADIETAYPEHYIFVQGDIADAETVNNVFEMQKPEFVINFAAETHVDRSIHVGSKEFVDTNVTGVMNILEAVKQYGCTKYVQVSTDEVYGQLPNPYDVGLDAVAGAAKQKFTEFSPFRPNVPYSATKAGGDCLCNAYFHTWKVPVVVTHCSNNYGPYQYPEKLVPFWATRILQGNKIPIYGDGMNVRDWIHVEDHIRGLILALLKGEPGETYNFGADNERTNLDMAQLISELIRVGEPWREHVEFVTDRPGHDRRYAINATKAKKQIGWKPQEGRNQFVAKLRETLQWYQDNHQWVENIIQRTGVANPHIDLWKAHPELNQHV